MGASTARFSQWPLNLLVALVVLSPWAFGGVHPRAAQAIAVVSLLASLAATALAPERFELPPRLLPSLLGLWVLGALQLVLLPKGLLQLLAPGSTAVWYPSEPLAATVLGAGPHPISIDPGATARWLAFTTALVALALLAAPALRERGVALRVAVAVVTGAVGVAVYGLVARLAFGGKLYGFLAVPTVAPFGPFVSKNHFAGYVEMAACLAVGLAVGLADEARRGPERLSWLDTPRASRVVFAWGAAATLVVAVPVSLSRGGVLSLAAGLVAFTVLRLWSRRQRRTSGRMLGLAFAALAVGAIVLAFVLPVEATARIRTLGRIGTDISGSYRAAIARDSLRLALTSPLLGSGFGAYEDAIPRFKSVAGDLRVEHAENDALELLTEGGLAGGVLAGSLVLAMITVALGRLRDEPHRLRRGLRSGALAGVAALLVHSVFDFNLRLPSNALLFVLLAAFALAPVGNGAPNVTPQEREDRRQRRVRALAGAVLATATVLAVTTPWTARRLDRTAFDRAAGGVRQGLRWRSLERDTVAHLQRRPADATTWVALGWLRQPSSQAGAAALASWGVSLDPQYQALRMAVDRITSAPAQIQPRTP